MKKIMLGLLLLTSCSGESEPEEKPTPEPNLYTLNSTDWLLESSADRKYTALRTAIDIYKSDAKYGYKENESKMRPIIDCVDGLASGAAVNKKKASVKDAINLCSVNEGLIKEF